ncbi:repeat element protein-d1.1 [Ichnoviriform fugitivi]|uniref:Repeat element protein-d1.1 n=1 Tax=Ichnoviriform fugitivi TaxID=265522 RepID=A2Q0J2_9VIRU|nr:repeat element protein-d1.1 [Ichnoviriform fugitivi]BAF45707.1 repeat element protein-d1.1 [Ichnoviriform fugitivi]
MSSQQDQDRALTFPMDTFTVRGPLIPDGSTLTVGDMEHFEIAYKLFRGSIGKLNLTFFNGKSCHIHYSFNATRPEADRLLINWDCLMPLFWGPPPGERSFVRLSTILAFVEEKLRFQRCMAVPGDTCSCGKKPNKLVSPGHGCKNKLHWHHFCTAHVSAWLTRCLVPAILFKEYERMINPITAGVHEDDPDISECYSTSERTAHMHVLLDLARIISGSGSGAAKSK